MSHQARKSPSKGPMKATVPMASASKSESKDTQPAWKTRVSPDHPSGKRSPGSSVYKSQSKPPSECSGSKMRRTASLDAIYVKEQTTHEFHMSGSYLQIDRQTQTDEGEAFATDCKWFGSGLIDDEKLEKPLIKQRLQKTASKESNSGKLAVLKTPVTAKASPIAIPTIKPLPKPAIRNSIEALNQEIERLVLSSDNLTDRFQSGRFNEETPDGHRAPLAELLKKTRSVDTQTPADSDLNCSYSSSGGGSQNSSPEQEDRYKLGTSPQINRFLAREPPVGCEKVRLKSLDEPSNLPLDRSQPKPSGFQLKPSQGSAFKPLKGPDDEEPPLPYLD